MFGGWDGYYLIVGSGAGALIGVMFIVETLTAGLAGSTASRGAQIYITPTVFHFAIVVIVSAVTAVPELPAGVVGVLLALCVLAGLSYTAVTAVRVFRVKLERAPDLSDKCFYAVLPVLIYLGFAGATAAIFLAPAAAAHAIGAVMLALLLLGIRNAWDLATYLVQNRP